ncbi:hypothetical protein BCR43DRAFT_557760 [Syncephalastrum racemosum]|uniref:Uncharacterized protein n=1 Tax=Syncephalastrum racemosum TaxID=13706 RepID=A0A1X2HB62_SYNRA|nr:hypothetical protein BCR43DRAFT_557760 [Syncephalastrum racemosum]
MLFRPLPAFRATAQAALRRTTTTTTTRQQCRRYVQPSFTRHAQGRLGFSTNPSAESMREMTSLFKRVFKLTGYTAIALGAGAALLWQSYHLYIEHFLESTPSELSYRARNLLHGAHVREKVAPDHEVAAVYLNEVLRIALEEQKLDEHSPVVIQLRLRLADDEARAGNLYGAITEYTRAWKLLKEAPENDNEYLMAKTAKEMGSLYYRVGDYEHAEEFLAWAFDRLRAYTDDTFLKVTTTNALASVYTIQRRFDLSMPLLLLALKDIPEDATESKWVCLKGILQNQLCETMYGMAKIDEALGWAQASLESCTIGLDLDKNKKGEVVLNRDCQDCRVVVANNLSKLLEMKGDKEQAQSYYEQSLMFAADAAESKTK